MSKIIELNELNIKNFISILRDDDIIVYENIQGSKILVNWDGFEFKIRPKNIAQETLNPIDLAVQKFYKFAFDYFNNLDIRVKKLLNKKYWYVFEYFYDETVYQQQPKNNLVLTGIIKGTKYTTNPKEITEFANLLEVDPQPIIFWGKLNTEQIELIAYFLKTAQEDLEYVFGEKNFAFFFYKILNPQLRNSFLMKDGFLQNMDKVIIKNLKDEISLAVLNPFYQKTAPYDSEHVEVYSLILLNFLEFLQTMDITKMKVAGENKYEIYIDLISQLFNLYVERRGESLELFKFDVPAYFNEDKFKINPEMINNPKTLELIKSSEKIEYIFKIILGSLRKKKNKTFGVFNETTLDFFNHYVDQIDYFLDKQLRISQDVLTNKTDVLNFKQFMELPSNQDASGKVYPDLFDTTDKIGLDKKKKGASLSTKNTFFK
jgi:hypothetical protein